MNSTEPVTETKAPRIDFQLWVKPDPKKEPKIEPSMENNKSPRPSRSPTPPLQFPRREYTSMELKVLEQLKPYHTHYRLYDTARRYDTASTLRALDQVTLHKFRIESDNLVSPLEDSLFLRDFRCFERPLIDDDRQIVGMGAMKFIIGQIADNQHWSMVDKTYVFDPITFTFTREINEEKMRNYVKAIIRRSKPENIFDKELLVFPSFFANGAFLTLVKNPKCGLIGYKDARKRNCEVSHICAGSARQYHDIVVPHLHTLLRTYASHFEPETPFGFDEYNNLELPKINQFDKPYVVLILIEHFLAAGYKFPDVNDIIDEIERKRPRILKEELGDCRSKWFEVLTEVCQKTKTEVTDFVMKKRQKILLEEKGPFKASSEDADDDVLLVE